MELRSGYVVGTGVLRPEHRPFFEEGIRLLLQRWTALCLAIENEWGGPSTTEKAEYLYQDVLTWFYRNKGAYLLKGARNDSDNATIL
jgi:pre-rRNA-processing protein TSR2